VDCYSFIEREILPVVEKPGRYTGNEINVHNKDFDGADARIALIYPDLYDVGMSYYGFQILYHLLNREHEIVADRAYAPWTDFEQQLRKNSIPLYGLETKTPLNKYDVLGFTLPYELTYTNILNILDLSHVPVFSKDRSEADPIVIAGGSNAYNPEPLADFIDIFLAGDGEEIIAPLVRYIGKLKRENCQRDDLLKKLIAEFEGLYIPRFYKHKPQSADGMMVAIPTEDGIPKKIKALRISSLKPEYFPEKPIIPLIEITQDRLVAEVMRGCTQGCRFCQAGMIYRPVRERLPQDLCEQIEKSLEVTGYENVSLLSLSSSDYCGIGELIAGISQFLDDNSIGLSLPSMRLDSFSESIAYIAQRTRKSGLTFAPEAGSERLRRSINKNITDEDLMKSVDIAMKYGWRSIKLYFMLGLPTETDEDIEGIARLTKAVLERSKKRLSINITLSTFVPKPFTPFQWEAQNQPQDIQRKLDLIKSELRKFKQVKIMARDPYYSQFEGFISRGDRAVSQVIYDAWKNGAKFDSWRELLNRDAWDRAFEKNGLNVEHYTGKRDVETALAWEHIDARITKKFLLSEREKAYRDQSTIDCRAYCIACGVCGPDDLFMNLVEIKEPVFPNPVEKQDGTNVPEIKYRLRYSKLNGARFISHLDTLHVFRQAMRRAKLSLSFTRGFNRRPKISAGYPLPLGYSSLDEYIDIVLNAEAENIVERLNSELPKGIQIISAETVPLKSQSLFSQATGFDYEVQFSQILPDTIAPRIDAILAQEELPVECNRKGHSKLVNIREFIRNIKKTGDHTLLLSLSVLAGQTARPGEVLSHLKLDTAWTICRSKTYLKPMN